MKLPDYLKFVERDGLMIHGNGPYTIYLQDTRDGKVHKIEIAAPTRENTVKYFLDEFAKQLKEQLGEDLIK